MIALEDLVRQTLAEHAEDAPDGTGLLAHYADAGEASRRSSRRWTVPLLVAALVAALVVGTIVVVKRQTADESRPAGPVATGLWRISFHGIEMDVPAAWQHPQRGCQGALMSDGLDLPVRSNSAPCAGPVIPQPGLTVKLLGVDQRVTLNLIKFAATTVAGVPAKSFRHNEGSLTTTTYVFPLVGVLLTAVTSSSAKEAELTHILGTIRVVGPTDSSGCAVSSAWQFRTPLNESSDRLFDGSVSSISVCLYNDTNIVNSSRLSGSAAHSLADELLWAPNAAPLNAGKCAPTATLRHFLLIIHRQQGDVTLTMNSSGCGGLTNGKAVRQSDPLYSTLLNQLAP